MTSYAVKRADGYIYEVDSNLDGAALFDKLRAEYTANDNIFSTFVPHINRIPVAIYIKAIEQYNNE
jgi:hypothetical protein